MVHFGFCENREMFRFTLEREVLIIWTVTSQNISKDSGPNMRALFGLNLLTMARFILITVATHTCMYLGVEGGVVEISHFWVSNGYPFF